MYQSCATVEPTMPSLGMRKCAISGERPVAVSCVRMHVSMSSMPVCQSRFPLGVSCAGRGGMETGRATAPLVAAPSMSDPPRKHAR